jgi:hypothetical protein
MIGSSSVTLFSAAWRNASAPACWKASSLESTSWYLPSVERRADVHERPAVPAAAAEALFEALLDRRDVLARNVAALDRVDELEAAALGLRPARS